MSMSRELLWERLQPRALRPIILDPPAKISRLKPALSLSKGRSHESRAFHVGRGYAPDARVVSGYLLVGGVAPTYGSFESPITGCAGARWRRQASLRSWRNTAPPGPGRAAGLRRTATAGPRCPPSRSSTRGQTRKPTG